MIENTDNYSCRCIVDILRKRGVTQVFASPGSRNTPLLIALSNCADLKTSMIVDERSAAFIALGAAVVSDDPVALVCTSGTAVLNYSPALAEAYYRKVPLIVISADRPSEWIDQDDSQTIRQRDALINFVKRSYDIPAYDSPDNRWFANRVTNDAVTMAVKQPCGPVHINLQIGEPIGQLTPVEPENQRVIEMLSPSEELSARDLEELNRKVASPSKVMIVAGFMSPDPTLNAALKDLALRPNVVVMCETLSNLHGDDFVSDIDATQSALLDEKSDALTPDVVISMGGAIVSRMIKQYLRQGAIKEHWHVGKTSTTVDCFKSLTTRIDMQPSRFFGQLASTLPQQTEVPADYRRQWITARDAARSAHQSFVDRCCWCDLKAFAAIMPKIPRNFNLQLSNGTPVRYAQLFPQRGYHRVDCNRGVSGIDGSTSTAIGATMAYESAPTLLISGDMSAQYDVGAFGSGLLDARFKMVVMCNGGGAIFHFIKSTRHLDIVHDCFDRPCIFPAEEIAKAYGLRYFAADDEATLRAVLPEFLSESERPALLAVMTDAELSGKTLREYFEIKI